MSVVSLGSAGVQYSIEDIANNVVGGFLPCGIEGLDFSAPEIIEDLGLDTVKGQSGQDSITADGDDQTVHGGMQSDKLTGEEGTHYLIGGYGDDVLISNDKPSLTTGWDIMTGGAGIDKFVVSGATTGFGVGQRGLRIMDLEPTEEIFIAEGTTITSPLSVFNCDYIGRITYEQIVAELGEIPSGGVGVIEIKVDQVTGLVTVERGSMSFTTTELLCVKAATTAGDTINGAAFDDSYLVDFDGGAATLIGDNGDDVFDEKPGMTTANGQLGDDTFIINFGGDGDSFRGGMGEDIFMITGEISPITLSDFGRFSVSLNPLFPPEHDKIIFSNLDLSDYPVEVSSEDYCAALPPAFMLGSISFCFPFMGSDPH